MGGLLVVKPMLTQLRSSASAAKCVISFSPNSTGTQLRRNTDRFDDRVLTTLLSKIWNECDLSSGHDCTGQFAHHQHMGVVRTNRFECIE